MRDARTGGGKQNKGFPPSIAMTPPPTKAQKRAQQRQRAKETFTGEFVVRHIKGIEPKYHI